ncbi:SUKH-4 family immunity protein [Streptomyces sp. CB02400]|uniref:SUKH-4 family immunity protein n=1 Tax=Streptomyces sp. CB02400 TaxID=1703944 RepID=UPI000938F75F|nr:SUKH-4 family immunity protein [Streptomyces sp. CB02400]
MVTFAQAQERAEEWVNGDVPSYQHREVRVREFGLGFVVWAEDRADGPRSDGGAQRLVIARDSGEATLWPALPVGEVIRRYEEEYGRDDSAPEPVPAPAARVDLNQTSFLLSPPEWLQEAADRLGIPDRRGEGSGSPAGSASGSSVGSASGPGADSSAGPAPGSVPGSGSSAVSDSVSASGSSAAPDASWASGAGGAASASSAGSAPGPAGAAAGPSGAGSGAGDSVPGAAAGAGDSVPGAAAGAGSGAAWPAAGGSAGSGGPVGATPWAGTDTNADAGEDRSVPLPETVFAPQLSESGDGTPPATPPEAMTALMSGGSGLPPTAVAPAIQDPGAPQGVPGTPPPAQGGAPYGSPQGPGGVPTPPSAGVPTPPSAGPGAPERPLAPNAGDIADAATSKAAPPPRRGPGVTTPPPPGAPGTPGARPGGTPTPPSAPAGGYVPTQMVSSLGLDGPGTPGGSTPPPGTPAPPPPPGGAHHAATMLAGPGGPGAPQPPGPPGPPGAPGAPGAPQPPGPPAAPGAPGAPQPPGPPGTAGGGRGTVHHAETVLAAPPVAGPGAPPPPAPPAPPGMPGGAPPMPPGGMPPAGMPPGTPPPGVPVPGRPPAYGYPQPPAGQPTVGPGYQAVLRYRAQDGSEQQLIRRSAPGTPHPEWQIFHELRAMNVPPDQVLELHTELESCELPGAYCARMIREQWPQARITSIAPYGTDHASRQQGMGQLLAHQGELHQVADGPARPAPVRAPIPPVQPAPPVPPEAVAQELAGAFGPGLFRFEQAAVSRQGVPPVVAHTLVVAGLPLDMGPFFWAQAQPGRPVPTLAELAAERGVQPASDAGSYLVMGSDFGKAICVQYGTANIVAVPVESGPGGAPVPPQFVNTGLPEFARCLALLGRMWRLRFGLNQEQAGRWTVDFQAQLAALDPAALGSPESWWSVLLEQMWDGLL